MFGCTELRLELNWAGNSKSKMERKWLQLEFYCLDVFWNLLLESKSGINSNSCLDVETKKLNDIV
jgi:hypothetical protein